MEWKYYIPHVWERDRQVWEDVYLLPAKGEYVGQALWLTIDALGDVDDPEHGSDRREFQAESLQRLGDRDYYMDGTDMVIRTRDFSKEELLEWALVWLRENGLPAITLIEGSIDEFQGKALHADLISGFHRK